MTITINARENLTYEEIFESYANGKSRLPKILKDIESGAGAGDPQTFAGKANSDGVEIKRRRTGGGNASNVSGLGLTSQPTIARMLSASRYNALISGYSPSGGEPSQNFIDADVRGVTKNPFDLIDFVSGILNSDQVKGSGDNLATRAAKLKAEGSNVVTRNFTELIQPSDTNYDVRTKFGDRIGGGGATGEVHGVDQGIPELIATDAQALVIGATAGTGYGMDADTTLGVDVDNSGVDSVVYPSALLTVDEAVEETNPQLSSGLASSIGGATGAAQIVLRSSGFGADGEVDVTEANTALGFPVATAVGSTVGQASLDADNTVIDLSGGTFTNVQTNIRYGTYQFGTLRIFTSINDADPVAYILHPDLLDDLIANNP